jgi:hypothetical protein
MLNYVEMKHAHPSNTPLTNPPFCLLSLEVVFSLSFWQFTPSCPFLSFALLSPPTRLLSLQSHKVLLLHIFAAILYCAFNINCIEWQKRSDIMKERKYVENEGIFVIALKLGFIAVVIRRAKMLLSSDRSSLPSYNPSTNSRACQVLREKRLFSHLVASLL